MEYVVKSFNELLDRLLWIPPGDRQNWPVTGRSASFLWPEMDEKTLIILTNLIDKRSVNFIYVAWNRQNWPVGERNASFWLPKNKEYME